MNLTKINLVQEMIRIMIIKKEEEMIRIMKVLYTFLLIETFQVIFFFIRTLLSLISCFAYTIQLRKKQ